MPAERIDRLVDERAAMRRIGDVAGTSTALRPASSDPARGLPRVVVLVRVGDQHVRALAREGDRDRAADAAVAAGDDGALAREPARALVALSPWSGCGSISAVRPGV